MHYFIPHLLLRIFFYCVRLITNRGSEFLTNFIIREGIEKDGLKLGVFSLIKTTYRNYMYFHVGENTEKFIRHRSDEKD